MIETRKILCPTDLSDIAVFGSTTQHVVRGARCPVLVIHTD